jgi:hypothetical protein
MTRTKHIEILIPEGMGKHGSIYFNEVEKLKRLANEITVPVNYVSVTKTSTMPVVIFYDRETKAHVHCGSIEKAETVRILNSY